MNIDFEQLKALAVHARTIGTEDKWMGVALEYTAGICEMLTRRTALLKEASGWLGPHEYDPVELYQRIQDELALKQEEMKGHD